MSLTDTRPGYGWTSISLHWIVAVLMIALFFIGEQFEDLGRDEGAFLRALHISLGSIAFVFVWARVAWRLAQGSPQKADDPKPLILLSVIVQWGLLLASVVLVVSGPLSIWTVGRPIDIFGIIQLASPLERNRELHEVLEGIHGVASKLLIPLFLLHVLGALKHAFINRDNVLLRMLKPVRDA